MPEFKNKEEYEMYKQYVDVNGIEYMLIPKDDIHHLKETSLCRYCKKDVLSYPRANITATFDRWGYEGVTRICACNGIDPLNKDTSVRKKWVVYGKNGWIVNVTPFHSIEKDATFSIDKKYRFALHRIWDQTMNKILFIMINPSTATKDEDDKTIKKIMEISDKWNYGGVYVGNLYPYCSSKPSELKNIQIPDEIHKENMRHIQEMVSKCSLVVYAWGTKGPDERQQEPEWLKNIVKKDVYCINRSVKGVPMHPNQWGPNVKPVPDEPILFRSIGLTSFQELPTDPECSGAY